jgi:predicted unusual protein kinase regulating ubiquinone biosynthesis (AarF/ABC1/UbiB family)
VAAASIGQVHRATRPGGGDVAVKVQYPGAAAAIRADLANTELLATFLSFGRPLFPWVPRRQIRAWADEISERIIEELDYGREAEHLAWFGAAYRDHPFIRIPAVHPELSTSRVLTMDFAEGRRWEDGLDAPAELRYSWGEAIFRFGCGSWRRLHRLNADPHPANYILHDDGAVSFVDFGCVKELTAETVERLVRFGRAAIDGDPAAIHDVAMEMGYVGSDGRPGADELFGFIRPFMRFVTDPQPFTFAYEEVAQAHGTKFERGQEGNHLILPAELVFMERIDVGVQFALAHLRATGDWRAIIDELDGIAPAQTDMGRAEAALRARETVR